MAESALLGWIESITPCLLNAARGIPVLLYLGLENPLYFGTEPMINFHKFSKANAEVPRTVCFSTFCKLCPICHGVLVRILAFDTSTCLVQYFKFRETRLGVKAL